MDFLINNLHWIGLAVVSGTMLVIPAIRGDAANAVSPTQAVMLLNRHNAVLVDVREASELVTAAINGARHIPAGELDKRVDELSKYKSKPVILVCATGNRSAKAADVLRKAGFEQVFNLTGGIEGWKSAGQPVVTKKA